MKKRFDILPALLIAAGVAENGRTSLAAFLLILLFAGAADGLMDTLGPVWFLVVGTVVLSVVWGLAKIERWATA